MFSPLTAEPGTWRRTTLAILDRCRAPIFTPTSAESPASPQGRLIGPRTLRLIRALSGLQRSKSHDGVEALILRSGVGVRLHRPVGVSQPGTRVAVDSRRRLRDGYCAARRPAVPSIRPRAGHYRRGGGLPAGARASLPCAAGGLLCGADLVGRACPPSTRHGWRSAGPARAADWRQRWRCWRVTAAR